jgi:hypothetical protein
MKHRPALDVVISHGAPVLHLLPRKDQPLLVRRDSKKEKKKRSVAEAAAVWSLTTFLAATAT